MLLSVGNLALDEVEVITTLLTLSDDALSLIMLWCGSASRPRSYYQAAPLLRSGAGMLCGVAGLLRLRATCRELRRRSCELAVNYYADVLRRANSAQHLPHLNLAPVEEVDMGEWAVSYMAPLSEAVLKDLAEFSEDPANSTFNELTLAAGGAPTSVSNELALAALVAGKAAGKATDGRADQIRIAFEPSQWETSFYHLLEVLLRRGPGRLPGELERLEQGTRLHLNGQLVHISLESVATWFGQFGWRLDTCAALLFITKSAEKAGMGSTCLAAEGHWIDRVLHGREALVEVQQLVLESVAAGREDQLLSRMRRRYDAERTAAWNAFFYDLLSYTDKYAGSAPAITTAVRGGFAQLLDAAAAEVKATAALPNTAMIFQRKMAACVPATVLRR